MKYYYRVDKKVREDVFTLAHYFHSMGVNTEGFTAEQLITEASEISEQQALWLVNRWNRVDKGAKYWIEETDR